MAASKEMNVNPGQEVTCETQQDELVSTEQNGQLDDSTILLFVGYFMTLSVTQTVQSSMVGWSMNNELERICKEAVIT
jgi:hypothetical protein